jgi:hypothetical protein
VVHVPNRPHVHVRLAAFKFLFAHDVCLPGRARKSGGAWRLDSETTLDFDLNPKNWS